jgi:3-methyladenine DNA glycosylase/8-oxoguanine DNA glycosylase
MMNRSGDGSTLHFAVPKPFELRLALFGHGWVGLEPHVWDASDGTLRTVIDLGSRAADVVVRAPGGLADTRALRRAIVRMLRLDEDLSSFWALCRKDVRFRWVARRGGGRLLRAPTLFEDLAKLLMTTNCSWAMTRNMVSRVTQALGRKSPSGARAFPRASACARQSERFFREAGRMGYRARPMLELSRGFASGALRPEDFEDPGQSTAELRERLLELPGFGPYAAGQALRLLGRYEDYALDSWCRAELAARHPKNRVPSDRTVARTYRDFGAYRGLALWMDLTAHWHGEAE